MNQLPLDLDSNITIFIVKGAPGNSTEKNGCCWNCGKIGHPSSRCKKSCKPSMGNHRMHPLHPFLEKLSIPSGNIQDHGHQERPMDVLTKILGNKQPASIFGVDEPEYLPDTKRSRPRLTRKKRKHITSQRPVIRQLSVMKPMPVMNVFPSMHQSHMRLGPIKMFGDPNKGKDMGHIHHNAPDSKSDIKYLDLKDIKNQPSKKKKKKKKKKNKKKKKSKKRSSPQTIDIDDY